MPSLVQSVILAQVICSNLYEEEGRVPGSVGPPIHGTQAHDHSVHSLVHQFAQKKPFCAGLLSFQLRLNDRGGIEIKSDSLFGGYWRNEEKTREEFTADGFFITGDVANVDERGIVV